MPTVVFIDFGVYKKSMLVSILFVFFSTKSLFVKFIDHTTEDKLLFEAKKGKVSTVANPKRNLLVSISKFSAQLKRRDEILHNFLPATFQGSFATNYVAREIKPANFSPKT